MAFMSLSPGNWSACGVFESDCVITILLFLTLPGHISCVATFPIRRAYAARRLTTCIGHGVPNWQTSSALHTGGPLLTAVGVRKRSLRGKDVVLRPCGLHTDHEQVEDHRDLRDC